jgi:hypothetical protein
VSDPDQQDTTLDEHGTAGAQPDEGTT